MMKTVTVKKLLPVYVFVLIGCLLMAHFTSSAVTVMVEKTPIEDRTCVVIDAGHGGIDGGATSCTGILESQLNLESALRLDDLLHFLGHDTKMIRTTDNSVYTEGNTIAAQKVSDLKERVRLVNETEKALLVSIHQNTFQDDRYSGAQVFYAGDPDSQMLAKKLQSALIQYLNPGSKRQSKPSDGIYLMQNINKTGVLIECGFLTNPEEESKIRSKAYQQQLCCVIAATINGHLSNT